MENQRYRIIFHLIYWVLKCFKFLFSLVEQNHNLMLCVSFFSSIFWCNHIGNHPRNESAKFGYKSQRELEIFKNLIIFLWNVANYYLHMAISAVFSLKSTNFDKKGIQKIPCYEFVHWIYFCCQVTKFHTKFLTKNVLTFLLLKFLNWWYFASSRDLCLWVMD